MSSDTITYLSLLTATMEKKEALLNRLILETIKQSNCFEREELLEEEYDEIYQKKMELVGDVGKLDEGFETLYQHVKEEIKENSHLYEEEIKALQNQIRSITNKSMRLQKLESDNKVKFERYLHNRRNQVKELKISKKNAAAYYKNMMQQFSKDT